MEFDSFIDNVAKKYSYDEELVTALKRIVPVMAKGKTNPEIQLLLDTLDRVQIFDFVEQPNKEQVDELETRKVNGRNLGVKFNERDLGEYGKNVSPGAYVSAPIFDENMNIVDRVGYLYVTRLISRHSQTAEFYGTTVNLSHLIHELGHAWAAQKGEYIQEENGNYRFNVGTSSFYYKIDKQNKTVTHEKTEGLYTEEALNTLEEERILCELLEIDSVKEIPDYIPSVYQGMMSNAMKEYTKTIGSLPFSKARITKNTATLEKYQDMILNTDSSQEFGTLEYIESKRKIFNRTSELTNVSENGIKRICDFFKKYSNVYFSNELPNTILGRLDSVLQQIYNFSSIKYNFSIVNIDRETGEVTPNTLNKEIYNEIISTILKEAYSPLNEAKPKIEEYNDEISKVSIKNLAKQALEIRT